MNDGFPKANSEELHEFEDIENAQSNQQSNQQSPKPAQSDQSNVTDKFDVKDEVGKMVETASQALFGSTDPAQVQQQQVEQAKLKQEDAKKIANVKNFLAQMAQDEQRLRQQREEEKQKKMEEEQEKQVGEQEEEAKKQNKEQSFQQQHILAEQSKAERKGGVGG